MQRLPLLIPVLVAVLWYVQRYRQGAFRRRPAPPAARPATAAPAAEPAWVYRPEDYGLVPDDRIDTGLAGPDPDLVRALGAVAAGDWRPAATLLADPDHERRWKRLERLAAAAAEDDAWVRAWRAARPGDAAAALVAADSLVSLAWKLRGGKRARDTDREQFQAFARVLAQAPEAFAEAARLDPADPGPYIGLVPVAMGQGWPHDRVHALWDEIVRRAPHHVGAHVAALQYWCAKWCGSTELMHSFAETAAVNAPAGGLLSMLRLIALYEEFMGEKREHPGWRSPAAVAAVEAVLADVAAAPPHHPWLPNARHLLVWFLRAQDRYTESAEQLRLVDGYIGALPWRYGVDQLAFYTAVRRHVVLAEERAASARLAGGAAAAR